MELILHQLIWKISHDLEGFYFPRWLALGFFSINRSTRLPKKKSLRHLGVSIQCGHDQRLRSKPVNPSSRRTWVVVTFTFRKRLFWVAGFFWRGDLRFIRYRNWSKTSNRFWGFWWGKFWGGWEAWRNHHYSSYIDMLRCEARSFRKANYNGGN